MINFERREYITQARIYNLNIDNFYIERVSRDIKDVYDEDVELTEQDYIDMLSGEYNEKLEMTLHKHYTGWDGEEVCHTVVLKDVMQDWLNDDAWDTDYYIDNEDTVDVYDDYKVVE